MVCCSTTNLIVGSLGVNNSYQPGRLDDTTNHHPLDTYSQAHDPLSILSSLSNTWMYGQFPSFFFKPYLPPAIVGARMTIYSSCDHPLPSDAVKILICVDSLTCSGITFLSLTLTHFLIVMLLSLVIWVPLLTATSGVFFFTKHRTPFSPAFF